MPSWRSEYYNIQKVFAKKKMSEVLFRRTLSPQEENFGSFLNKILNLRNRLPVDKYRVSQCNKTNNTGTAVWRWNF